jgi:hypothetical protein
MPILALMGVPNGWMTLVTTKSRLVARRLLDARQRRQRGVADLGARPPDVRAGGVEEQARSEQPGASYWKDMLTT